MNDFRLATIDLDAISHNVETLRALIGVQHVVAVVKADAYGHGAVPAARAALAGGADWLGVTDFSEAAELRDAGIDAPLLTWLHAPGADFVWAISNSVDIGVSSLAQLREVVAAAGQTSAVAYVHLKADTGLSRNGIAPAEWAEVFAEAAAAEKAGGLVVRGLFSHLANAGEDEDNAQIAAFERAIDGARAAGLDPAMLHLAATAGALARPSARFNTVRVGIGIYGLSPDSDGRSAEYGLRPVMTLTAPVIAVRDVDAGTGVSYNYLYKAEAATRLALVPLGYADGIPRAASGRARVRIDGADYPVVGRVAMDQCVIDCGTADVRVGSTAVLFGDPAAGAPSADEFAESYGTINYELVTGIGPRVERRYLGGGGGGEGLARRDAS